MPLALIIDDHPIVLQGCLETIKAHGACDVLGTSSLADGFRAYRRWRPDIVILDLSFRDNAREAMEFYRSVFGGELTFTTLGGVKNSPPRFPSARAKLPRKYS